MSRYDSCANDVIQQQRGHLEFAASRVVHRSLLSYARLLMVLPVAPEPEQVSGLFHLFVQRSEEREVC